MKRVILPILLIMLFLAGCKSYTTFEESLKKIPNSDAGSARIISNKMHGDGYAKDDSNVYYFSSGEFGYKTMLISQTDAKTFEDVRYDYSPIPYGKDKNSVFYRDMKIFEADLNSFQAMEFGFSKDKNRVFYKENLISNADPNSFKIRDYRTAEDNRYIYRIDQNNYELSIELKGS